MKCKLTLLCLVGHLSLVGAALAQSGREGPVVHTPETAGKVVARFFAAARAGKAKVVARCGEELLAHGSLAVAPLLRDLESRSKTEVLFALRAIGHLGVDETRDVVLGFCSHDDAAIRAEAIVAGCRAHPSSMTRVLEVAVGDSDSMVRRRAFDGVLALSPGDREPFLSVASEGVIDTDFWVRSRCLRILAGAGPARDGSPDPLMAGARRLIPRLTKEAATPFFRVVAKVRPDGVTALVVAALKEGSIPAQAAAFAAAGALGDRTHVGVALRLIKSRSDDIAMSAIAYLGRIGDRESCEALVRVLAGTLDQARREALVVALRQITGKTFGYDVAAWRAWLDEQ